MPMYYRLSQEAGHDVCIYLLSILEIVSMMTKINRIYYPFHLSLLHHIHGKGRENNNTSRRTRTRRRGAGGAGLWPSKSKKPYLSERGHGIRQRLLGHVKTVSSHGEFGVSTGEGVGCRPFLLDDTIAQQREGHPPSQTPFTPPLLPDHPPRRKG